MDGFILQDWLVLSVTLLMTIIVLVVARRLLLGKGLELNNDQKLPRQLVMLVVSIVAVVVIVLALPVSESSRNQLLALFGVLLSGVIAFSSTTIVSNLMAGVVLRVNRPFRTGDFIICEGLSGRVTEKGILDTEIQTPERRLIHIANSFLINHPVEVVRTSGTLIHAEVSIGYDVHHSLVEEHLVKAAENAGLSDAFVHITELGNFSVNYKVFGLLADTKSILTSTSRLHGCVLDELHNNGIEIMSPNVISPRPIEPGHQLIANAKSGKPKEFVAQEDIAFDKAEEAEKFEQATEALQSKITELSEQLKSTDASVEISDEQEAKIAEKIEKLKTQLIALQNSQKQKVES